MPYHISHNNPKSKDYIYSEANDKYDRTVVESYNHMVDRLKSDIKLQRQVHEILLKMDRPWKHGLPGVHRNLSSGLKDYGKPEDIGFEHIEDPFNDFLDRMPRNEDRFLSQSLFEPKYAPMPH
jgi:hypothetical protein